MSRLWAARPHQWGAGKIHIVDPEDESKTMCGKRLDAIPGSWQAGEASCSICLNAVPNRQESRDRRAEYERNAETERRRREADNAAWHQRYQAYLRGPEWRQRREAVMWRDASTCRACGWPRPPRSTT